MDKYYQCVLRRYLKDCYIETVNWIPEIYATKEKGFQMEDREGFWFSDWVIVEAYPQISNRTDWSGQRKTKDYGDCEVSK